MAGPVASSAKAVTFGGFKRRVASFRLASVAFCDIPTCFLTCRKPFSVAERQVVSTRKFRGSRMMKIEEASNETSILMQQIWGFIRIL
jgi:hypothetical protein